VLPKKLSSGPAPEAVPELILELAHGVALSVVHEPVHVLSVDLSPSLVLELGPGAVLEAGREADRFSLDLPEVQKA
jgi:hypothetical protein